MKPEVIQRLSDTRDFCSLTQTLLAMCEPYGPVHSFRMVHNRGVARVACFIELASPQRQPALERALGARSVGGAACLDIPVRKDFDRPPAEVQQQAA